MTKLNFTRKFLVSAITLFAVNFAVANDENILKFKHFIVRKITTFERSKKDLLSWFICRRFYVCAISNCL